MSARNEQRIYIVKRLGRSWEKRGGVETQVFRGLHKGKMCREMNKECVGERERERE